MFRKIALPFFITAFIVIISFLVFNDLEYYFINLLNNFSHHHSMFALVSFLVLTADILLPVPSSIVMYVNGYVLGAYAGSILSLVSLLSGAVIGYYLGSLTSIKIKTQKDDKANQVISRYGAIAILISRGIPVLSESISIVCGYNKMPFKKYCLFNLIGYIPLCFLYAFFGSVGYDKNTFLLSFASSILMATAIWFFGKKYLVVPVKPGSV